MFLMAKYEFFFNNTSDRWSDALKTMSRNLLQIININSGVQRSHHARIHQTPLKCVSEVIHIKFPNWTPAYIVSKWSTLPKYTTYIYACHIRPTCRWKPVAWRTHYNICIVYTWESSEWNQNDPSARMGRHLKRAGQLFFEMSLNSYNIVRTQEQYGKVRVVVGWVQVLHSKPKICQNVATLRISAAMKRAVLN